MDIISPICYIGFSITAISMIIQYLLRRKLLKEFDIDTFKRRLRLNSKTISRILSSRNLTEGSQAYKLMKNIRLLGIVKAAFFVAWLYALLAILQVVPKHI